MEEIKLEDINLYDIGNEIQMAGTIWTGKGLAFITLVPGKDEDFSNLKKLPMTLDEWKAFLRQSDLLETEMFAKDETGITKILYRKSQRTIDAYMQWAVFQRDSYTCRYCGRTGIPLTVDHIDLYENGGATVPENLISSCKSCNKDRGRMEYEEWINSKIYKSKAANLSEEVKKENVLVLGQLKYLESLRVKNIRSR